MKHPLLLLLFMIPLVGNAQQDKFSLSSALNEGRTYGAYCGFAGQHPPTRIALDDLLIEENVHELLEWLESPNDVIKTYAAEGLIRMSNEGKAQLTGQTITTINKLKNAQREISTCKGCVFSQLTIAEALKPFTLESYP